jgi:hypothetical protein
MFYPTVYDKESNLIHMVKDRSTCECSFRYNVFFTFIRSDYKKIIFKPVNAISCSECKTAMNDQGYKTTHPSGTKITHPHTSQVL